VDNPEGSEYPPISLFISYIDTSVTLQAQQAVKRKLIEKEEAEIGNIEASNQNAKTVMAAHLIIPVTPQSL
jgi:hypothetical protein